MRLDYETTVYPDGEAQFEIKMYTPCCTEATALILEKLIEIQAVRWLETSAYLVVNEKRFPIRFCPFCREKIKRLQTKIRKMVLKTRTVQEEYWDEA